MVSKHAKWASPQALMWLILAILLSVAFVLLYPKLRDVLQGMLQ